MWYDNFVWWKKNNSHTFHSVTRQLRKVNKTGETIDTELMFGLQQNIIQRPVRFTEKQFIELSELIFANPLDFPAPDSKLGQLNLKVIFFGFIREVINCSILSDWGDIEEDSYGNQMQYGTPKLEIAVPVYRNVLRILDKVLPKSFTDFDKYDSEWFRFFYSGALVSCSDIGTVDLFLLSINSRLPTISKQFENLNTNNKPLIEGLESLNEQLRENHSYWPHYLKQQAEFYNLDASLPVEWLEQLVNNPIHWPELEFSKA